VRHSGTEGRPYRSGGDPFEQSKEHRRWHMKMGDSYVVKPFDLQGLVGISDRTLEMQPRLARCSKMDGLIMRKCQPIRS
jgi:hypothetical protein